MNILLFGSSYMAEEYVKVIKKLGWRCTVIGRNHEKAETLAKKYGYTGFGQGEEAIKKIPIKDYDGSIIASAIESLKDLTIALTKASMKNILIEKPGALNLSELEHMEREIPKDNHIRIAHNRRFYNSVLMLREHIKNDGGPVGCFFDFTDREKDILNSQKHPEVLKQWGFANSTHVIDTAFFLVGMPIEISSERSGSYAKHPSGNVFVGHGKTHHCLFSYFATWAGGGRWNIEVSTTRGRYKLCPLEELSFCEKNQFKWVTIDPRDTDDITFKPGLYKMVKSFFQKEASMHHLPTITEQIETCKAVNRIFGYD
jgi:predicted dehydrogenase